MRQPWRLGPRGTRLLDVSIAGVLVLFCTASIVAEVVNWAEGVLSLLQCVPLLWRRSHPVWAGAAVVAATAVQPLLNDQPLASQLAVPVAVYSVARFADARWGVAMLTTGVIGAGVASYDWLSPFGATHSAYASYFLTITAIVATAWALGSLGRTREAYVASLVDRGRRLEHEAEQQAALAAADERARIAREMHDVVAHGLSVIVVQADGARYAAAQDPALATETLATISATGRESLTEMRRMLGLLRSEASGIRPQPVLADVPHLVAEAGAGGMSVEADLPDPLPDVADGVGLTVYRVVQEALTNVRKHAGPEAHVTLRMGVAHDALEVVVSDDGRGAGVVADGRGLGLVGMRERVTSHGGELHAGPRAGGGYEISARIPR